ncbi:MAG: hypothetical protein K0R05_4686 [Anaerocolumna sp.]|nr:hypothetical protein [Anaerocolumna sp.]
MDNIFSMTCNLQRRSIVLPVNYYTMIENGYGSSSLTWDVYYKNCISICTALDRCCGM